MSKLYALHGFLGTPDDWDFLPDRTVQSIDLFTPPLAPDLHSWGENFNKQITESSPVATSRILMGYSLGGRLAIHALLQNPSLWHAAIIISANPGLTTDEERSQRQILDKKWATRFENEHWEQLISDWNQQKAFQSDSFAFTRREKDYDRKILADSMRNWSLGKQEYLNEKISTLPMPILWMIGENDPLAARASEIKLQHPQSKIWLAEDAGHRLPWQQPKQFLLKLSQFIDGVTS